MPSRREEFSDAFLGDSSSSARNAPTASIRYFIQKHQKQLQPRFDKTTTTTTTTQTSKTITTTTSTSVGRVEPGEVSSSSVPAGGVSSSEPEAESEADEGVDEDDRGKRREARGEQVESRE